MTEIHSDWDDWLVQEIAETEPETVSLWYLGCNGFALKSSDGTTIFIDPYLGLGDPPRTVRMIPVPFDPTDVEEANAVLATHEHTDHVHGPSQAPILGETGATFYAPAASMAVTEEEGWQEQWNLETDQFETVVEGETFELGDLTITVGPANDPDADEPVAYVIEHESGTFVHGGDARPGDFADLGEEYDIDLGALAFGSTGMIPDKQTRVPKETTWYNDENMVIEAAAELQLDRLIPTHWDMWKGLTSDPKGLHNHARSFDHPDQLEIVEIGDRIEL